MSSCDSLHRPESGGKVIDRRSADYSREIRLYPQSRRRPSHAVALFPFICGRICVEERFLRETLQGYADYMNRVPYRLVPFVWQEYTNGALSFS